MRRQLALRTCCWCPLRRVLRRRMQWPERRREMQKHQMAELQGGEQQRLGAGDSGDSWVRDQGDARDQSEGHSQGCLPQVLRRAMRPRLVSRRQEQRIRRLALRTCCRCPLRRVLRSQVKDFPQTHLQQQRGRHACLPPQVAARRSSPPGAALCSHPAAQTRRGGGEERRTQWRGLSRHVDVCRGIEAARVYTRIRGIGYRAVQV